MELHPGDRVEVESESTERPPRPGVIEQVLQTAPAPRYLIRWDDGHQSIYAPAAGSIHPVQPAKRG
jgi:hypothetical protein